MEITLYLNRRVFVMFSAILDKGDMDCLIFYTHNFSEDTQRHPKPHPLPERKKDAEQTITKQTLDIKPQTHKDKRQMNRLGMVDRKPTGGWNQFYSRKISSSLRKHAYSNILKILPPTNENFQIKKFWYLFIFLLKT